MVSSSAQRVLFVEFVTTDRFHCALHFPHARGLLTHLGVPARWLRFGMRAAVQFARGEEGIGLDEGERATLAAAARAHDATHVVFSHHPAPSVLRVFAADGGAAPALAVFGSVAGLSRVSDGDEAGLPSFDNVSGLQQWLGVTPPFDVDLLSPPADLPFAPAWTFEPANAAARDMQPFVFVLAGAECSYLHSIADNPHFADLVSDDEAPARFGCTFCRRPLPDGRRPRGVAPLDWAIAQLEAVARTHPPSATGELSLRIVGEGVVRRLDDFAERVAALGLAPAEILVDTRSDTLARLRERFDRAAARFGEAGHRLEVCLIGVENFAAAELERFNKGFGPEANLAAARVLRELERDHPGAFGFRKYGGLSTVLYTPWTTLEDVALNLATIRHFSLKRICGKVLTSRVRLYEELPLAARARRDGLLVDSYDDPALDTARRNFYESELPWRFQDPRVDRFNRIATRLQVDPALAGEPLYEEVQRWRAGAEADEVDLAERLCRAIERDPSTTDLSALVRGAADVASLQRGRRDGPEGVTQSARPAGAPPSTGDGAEGPVAGARGGPDAGPESRGSRTDASGPASVEPGDPLLSGSVDWRGFVAGIKPVCRLEPLSPDELARVEPLIRDAVPDAVLQARRRDWNDVESYELFVGRDEAEVDELIGILGRRDAGVQGDEGRAHVRRTGELLGYAPCCVERFADTPEVGWLHNEWLHVRNRVEEPGPVPTAIRPLNGPLSYVVCSATCAASLAKAEVLRARGDESVDPPKAPWPMLFLLDKPAHFAVLEPLSPVGERFRYRVAERYGDEERFDALAVGDTLVVDPGQIRVLDAAGRVLAQFSLDAYVWWHERAFHPEYWRLAVQQKLDPVPGPDEPDDEDRGVDEGVPEVAEEEAEAEEAAHVPRLDAVLGWMKRYLTQAGLPCASVLPTTSGDLDITLSIGDHVVTLRWLNRDAPDGVAAVLGAPLVPRGRTSPRAVQKLAPRLQTVLRPAWLRVLRDRLDRGNREHTSVDPTQGVRFLVRKRLAEGRPLWGSWVLERFEEVLGDDGRSRATLVARDGARTVTVAFGPDAGGGEAPPFYTSSLGVLRVVQDDRTDEARAHVADQIERCVGFHFSRAVPPDATWGPVPPPRGEVADDGEGDR